MINLDQRIEYKDKNYIVEERLKEITYLYPIKKNYNTLPLLILIFFILPDFLNYYAIEENEVKK